MATARIMVTDLPVEIAAALRDRAAAFGIVLVEEADAGDTALRAVGIAASAAARGDVTVAVGESVDRKAQARALASGAADVVDLCWSDAYVAARFAQLAEREALRRRIATELATKERELADARALQLAMVPQRYADERVSVDVVLEPATELGGDLVDHVRIHDGRIVLALGDVSGKGAAAALTMARTHTLLRSLALRAYAADLLSPPTPPRVGSTACCRSRTTAACS